METRKSATAGFVQNIVNIATLLNPGNAHNVASYIPLEGMHRIAQTCANKRNLNY